jgi:uncharacterized protein (DUF1697 family)
MTHIAFLRAINVGGTSVVKMTDLKAAFERAGCHNVRTFIASGNVVFDAPPKLPATLTTKIRKELLILLGKEPGICYRRLDEIDALIEKDPFARHVGDKTRMPFVAFMDQVPANVPKLPMRLEKECVEITGIHGADMLILSWRTPRGMFGFPNACVEAMGVTATTRNWNTVTRVAAFARK